MELLRQPEGKTLEFKREVAAPTGVLRTLVAFANTAGGTLVIGVEDRTRHVRGIRTPLDLEERLASLVSDSIQPRLVPDLEILPYRRAHVLAVRVYPSSSRPHYLAREGPDAGVYVRVGSTNRRADRELIAELQRFARGESFDAQALPDLDSEAVDFRAASESFRPFRRLTRADLETLHMVTPHQGRVVPTVGGLLLFGKPSVRDRAFPDAWLQAGRFRGTDRSGLLDRVEIRAHLPQLIEGAIGFVAKHSLHGATIGPVRRQERWTLPPAAIREAVINAVAHADYAQQGAPIRLALFEDRLEVESPGLLPFGLTVEDLHRGISKLRNRVIGRVFHELGLIEQWGSGIQRMAAACREAGLAAPTLEEIATRFRVTLHTTPVRKPAVDPTDHAILALLTQPQGCATAEIAAGIGLTPRATRTRLARLVQQGVIREVGTGPQDPKRRYFRTQ